MYLGAIKERGKATLEPQKAPGYTEEFLSQESVKITDE
jgi:hypothetical protein